MSRRLGDRVAIVTGGGRGIGRATSVRFAAEGAHVVIATRSTGPGEEVRALIEAAGGSAEVVEIDAGRKEDILALIGQVTDRHGRLDIVVHNAGYAPRGELAHVSDADIEHVLALNLLAGFHLLAAADAALRASPAGRLLFTSSIVGLRQAHAGYGLYGTTKAALTGFIRQAALELAASGVTVNGVEPGVVATEAVLAMPAQMRDALLALIPSGRATRPEDVAAAHLFLASDDAAHITGQTIIVDGGQTLGLPPAGN